MSSLCIVNQPQLCEIGICLKLEGAVRVTGVHWVAKVVDEKTGEGVDSHNARLEAIDNFLDIGLYLLPISLAVEVLKVILKDQTFLVEICFDIHHHVDEFGKHDSNFNLLFFLGKLISNEFKSSEIKGSKREINYKYRYYVFLVVANV